MLMPDPLPTFPAATDMFHGTPSYATSLRDFPT
ncbi:hypothetical protein ATCC53582_02402 [Novacetimonas hansenii]|nr:hypothetical protein ATCC53582_02402 [Novacetimonas hansenii]